MGAMCCKGEREAANAPLCMICQSACNSKCCSCSYIHHQCAGEYFSREKKRFCSICNSEYNFENLEPSAPQTELEEIRIKYLDKKCAIERVKYQKKYVNVLQNVKATLKQIIDDENILLTPDFDAEMLLMEIVEHERSFLHHMRVHNVSPKKARLEFNTLKQMALNWEILDDRTVELIQKTLLEIIET